MISDALPIQFWDADDETFNEKEICGINPQCFCLPVECDDIISEQFIGDYSEFSLAIHSSNALIDRIPLDEISSGVWGFTFSPSDYSGLCDEQIQLKIVYPEPTVDALASWNNLSTGSNWTTGATPTITLSPAPASVLSSKILGAAFAGLMGETYSFDYDVTLTDPSSNTGSLLINLYDGSFNILASHAIYNFTPGNLTGTALLTPSANTAYVGIRLITLDGGTEVTVDVNSVTFNSSGDTVIKKSDCLDVKESHDCTKLIEYSNESDFDGIVYSDISPRPVFYLRIPAILFEEDNPQEQEDLVLSNGVIVTLRQEIQEKRLLETGYMPNYMHKKLQKVLMHESITIDGEGWKRRDAYESNPIKKYALKRASVLLTKYNSVLKNTI